MSKDGTPIGYRQFGQGPHLVLLHGGMKSGQDLTRLAAALAGHFTVSVPDRRGRGASGPAGDGFGIEREVEDVQALIAETGARLLFGLSAGALVVLRTALVTPAVRRIGLYEPPLSVRGSTPTAWVPRYERELAAGRSAAALVTGLRGLAVVPAFVRLPRVLLVPPLRLLMLLQGRATEERTTIRSLVPTWRYDMRIVAETADTLDDYRNLRARVLLLGGTKSPAWLGVPLAELAAALPRAERVELPGLGHDGPENDGDPEAVARSLLGFFADPPDPTRDGPG